jgi:plastocyanin
LTRKYLRDLYRIFVPLVLSSCLMLVGCAGHEVIIANTTLVIPSSIQPSSTPSATVNTTPALPSYHGAVIPALEGEGPADIWLDNYESRPNVLIVTISTTVTWTNNDYWKPLTVVSDDGLFASDIQPSGGKFSYLFEYAGTFGYTIDPYSGVWQGVVIVVA